MNNKDNPFAWLVMNADTVLPVAFVGSVIYGLLFERGNIRIFTFLAVSYFMLRTLKVLAPRFLMVVLRSRPADHSLVDGSESPFCIASDDQQAGAVKPRSEELSLD